MRAPREPHTAAGRVHVPSRASRAVARGRGRDSLQRALRAVPGRIGGVGGVAVRGCGGGVAPGLLALAPWAALALALPFLALLPLLPLLVFTPMLPSLPPPRARVLAPAALCGLLACAESEQRAWWWQRAALARPALGALALAVSVCFLRPWCCVLGTRWLPCGVAPATSRDVWLGARTAGAETGPGAGLVEQADDLP